MNNRFWLMTARAASLLAAAAIVAVLVLYPRLVAADSASVPHGFLAIMLMGMTFNGLNSYFIGSWLFEFAPAGKYTMEWLSSPQFIIGGLVFLTGMLINLDSDHVIRHLRKPGDTKHYIPKKGLYKYVTSANYFGELTEWVGYAILTWSPAGLLFAVWTFANLAPRSKALTEKYEQEFGDEYKELKKKNLIPFIW